MHRALPTNAYHLLSIQPNATTSQIKGAYLKLVMVWHPDKNDDPKAPAKFKEVQDAFDTLSDPVTRASHDRDLGGPGAGAPPANARSGQWNYGGRAKGYDHPGGNVERPRAAPSGSKSGKIFDKDVWSRMHYNIMKEQDEKEHLLQAAEKLQNVGMPFEKVDMASNKTLYMGTTRTVTKEMTQMDMKKRIKNKLHEKREARIRDKARIDKMDVGGGGGSCVIA